MPNIADILNINNAESNRKTFSGIHLGSSSQSSSNLHLSASSENRNGLDRTLNTIILPLNENCDFIYFDNLTDIINFHDKIDFLSVKTYKQHISPEPFISIANSLELFKEKYPIFLEYDSRLSNKEKAKYITTALLPFIPKYLESSELLKFLNRPIENLLNVLAAAGAAGGAIIGLPFGLGGALIGGITGGGLGYYSPFIYGVIKLTLIKKEKNTEKQRILLEIENNHRFEDRIQSIANQVRYQETANSVQIHPELNFDNLSFYMQNNFREPSRTQNPILKRAISTLLSDSIQLNSANYSLQRYYRGKI